MEIQYNKIKKGDKEMGEGNYRKLNMDLVASKPSKESSTADALADIVPIDWSPDVLSGRKKAVVDIPIARIS